MFLKNLLGGAVRGVVTLVLGFAAAAIFCLAAAVALGMAAVLVIVLLTVFLVRPADAKNIARGMSGKINTFMTGAGGLAKSFMDVL